MRRAAILLCVVLARSVVDAAILLGILLTGCVVDDPARRSGRPISSWSVAHDGPYDEGGIVVIKVRRDAESRR